MKRYVQFIAVLALVALQACATQPQTPAQAVYAATATYDAALSVALTYARLPRCGPGVVPVCSQPEVVAKLQVADIAAFAAVQSAQKIVRDPKTNESTAQAAVATAREALSVLTTITASLDKGAK